MFNSVVLLLAAGLVCVQAQTTAQQKADGALQSQEGYFYISSLHDIGEPALIQSDDTGKPHAYRLVLTGFPSGITRVWRLQIHGDGTGTFFAKKARFNQATLLFSKEQTVATGAVDEFLSCVSRADFWQLPTREPDAGKIEANTVDGSYWYFEGVHDGQYHLVYRRAPEGRLGAFTDMGRCLGKDVGDWMKPTWVFRTAMHGTTRDGLSPIMLGCAIS